MGASAAVVPGSDLPITLLLEDGNTGKFPQAEVRNEAGTLLTTLNLSHVASGLYTNTTYQMPDEDWVVVTYIVYDDAGHTTESLLHLRAQDVFSRDRGGLLSLYDNGRVVAVHYDATNGSPGSILGINGTVDNPVDNESDMLALASALGIRAYCVSDALTLTTGYPDSAFYSDRRGFGFVSIGTEDVTDCFFEGLTLAGDTQGAFIQCMDCILGGLVALNGVFTRCLLQNTGLSIAAGGSTFIDCRALIGVGGIAVSVSFAGSSGNTMFRSFSGDLRFTDLDTAGVDVEIDFVGGSIDFDSTCTAGQVTVSGWYTRIQPVGGVGTTINDKGSSDRLRRETTLREEVDFVASKIVAYDDNGDVVQRWPVTDDGNNAVVPQPGAITKRGAPEIP